jgi:hypothetical protein
MSRPTCFMLKTMNRLRILMITPVGPYYYARLLPPNVLTEAAAQPASI